MIKAIFLDIDLTLADTTKANQQGVIALTQKIVQTYNTSKNNAQKIAQTYREAIYGKIPNHWQIKQDLPLDKKRCLFLFHALCDNQVRAKNNDTLEKLHCYFNQKRMENFNFFNGVKQLLQMWHRKYKLIVITNGPSYSQRQKIKQLNLANYVDAILVGGEQPHPKPHKSIFMRAMSLYNLTCEQCIHIGDNYQEDVIGAQNANIQAIWITKNNKKIIKNNKKDCHIVDKLLETRILLH